MMRIHNRYVAVVTGLAAIPVFLLYYTASTVTTDVDSTTFHTVNHVSESDYGRKLLETISFQREQLRAREDNYRRKRGRASGTSSSGCSDCSDDCQVIHLCVVSAGYKAARDLTTVIKSIVFYRRKPIHLHLIVDGISLPILKQLLTTWDLPAFAFSFYLTSTIEPRVNWISNRHYSGVFGLMKLEVPYILPDYVDKVITLDTDVVLADDIGKLSALFDQFNSDQVLGLVDNLSNWYLENSTPNDWPALGEGFNTGVMMMNTRRMREMGWSRLWTAIAKKYLPITNQTKLADQDIINTVIKENPDILYSLPCTWNVQISHRTTFQGNCYDTNSAQVIHFNSPQKYHVYYGSPSKDTITDYFKNFYFMFVQYDGNLLRHKYMSSRSCLLSGTSNNTDIKPTASLLIQRSPDVFAACYQVEGIRQSSQGRLHVYYMPFNLTIKPGDITLVAQFSLDRLGVLELLAEFWTGPMSLCLYLSDSEAQQFHDYVTDSPLLSGRQNIGYHIVFKTGMHYPVNRLRNVALDQALTDYVFLTDIDFLPMSGLYEYLRDAAVKHDISRNKLALVVPAFETQQYRPEMPVDKENLAVYVKNNLIQIFRNDVWPEGHAPTDYKRWYNASEPYQVAWQQNYEPYIAVSKALVPKYDERFFGFGWNKVSHIMELDAQGLATDTMEKQEFSTPSLLFLGKRKRRGRELLMNMADINSLSFMFKMMVVPNGFIIHAPHAPSLDISQYRSSPIYRKCLQTLKKEFQKDLSRKYGIRALKYLSND